MKRHIEVCDLVLLRRDGRSTAAARYSVAGRAESIGRAFEIVGRQNTGRDAEIKFPVGPETCFVRDAVTTADAIDREAA